jgi:threonine aldolase
VDNNRARLVDDHTNAAALAAGLAEVPGVTINSQDTNMVFAQLPVDDDEAFMQTLVAQDIRVRSHRGSSRMVTHIDITRQDVDVAVAAIAQAL